MIKINHLTKDYGQQRGIFDLTFDVQRGEVFGFLGPNGAGKTTTIRHLMGFIHPNAGNCSINGLDCGTHSAEIQRNLGYMPGEIALPEDMTGLEFLHFVADYRGVTDWARVEQLMARFELDARGNLKRMSKGMKQKIGIVCAFMHDPQVLILDEPTSGLDPLMQNHFIDLVLEEKAKGKTILMSSHIFEEVERTADRVGIIREGHLVTVDSVAALKAAQRKRYAVSFASEKEAQAFAKEPLAVDLVKGQEVTVTVNDFQPFVAAMSRYTVVNIVAVEQSLEEIFMHYYGK